MQLTSERLSQAATVWLSAAAALLALGVLLLATESVTQGILGTDVGPWGANFVILGAIVGAYGFWRYWPRFRPRTGLKLSALLIALGLILLSLAPYAEPFLVRIVAVAALLPGLRGAIFYIGAFLPRPRHDGVMSLGEKAAVFSLAANALLVIYLLMRSQALSEAVAPATGGAATAIAATAAVVLGVFIAESAIVAFLRRRESLETLEDERDKEIAQNARGVAHAVLVTAVLILVFQLGIGGAMEPSLSPNEVLGLSSPLAIAHALLALLFLSQGSRSIAELWQYRRARL